MRATCSISKLSITESDEIVIIPLLPTNFTFSSILQNKIYVEKSRNVVTHLESTDLYTPLHGFIYGKQVTEYDISSIEDDYNNILFKKRYGFFVHDIVNNFASSSNSLTCSSTMLKKFNNKLNILHEELSQNKLREALLLQGFKELNKGLFIYSTRTKVLMVEIIGNKKNYHLNIYRDFDEYDYYDADISNLEVLVNKTFALESKDFDTIPHKYNNPLDSTEKDILVDMKLFKQLSYNVGHNEEFVSMFGNATGILLNINPKDQDKVWELLNMSFMFVLKDVFDLYKEEQHIFNYSSNSYAKTETDLQNSIIKSQKLKKTFGESDNLSDEVLDRMCYMELSARFKHYVKDGETIIKWIDETSTKEDLEKLAYIIAKEQISHYKAMLFFSATNTLFYPTLMGRQTPSQKISNMVFKKAMEINSTRTNEYFNE